ncbi:hypothetical protein Aph01nite_62750 [Acrocarpospora phusangensis]|uniref:DUF4328 domain-containing protein n=1 Tax=Acrocarpospora phusangensis TaxID=1070424 RepID=A0A919UU09_9ACTN|nr:hypothetical protein [Acrocarpospora phusangensis]GIH27965.1 hypothetical protein Aph01nite_62750 [Acrocarpospora phusangensis]
MRSLRRAATGVYAALTAQVAALGALVLFEEVRGRRLAREIASFDGDPYAPGAREVVGAVTVFAVLMMIVVVTTLVAAATYLVWLRRARASSSATSVLAAWLLPGVNLIAPPLLADWAWQDAERRGRTRWLALLTTWWISWLVVLWILLVRLPGAEGLTGLGLTELAAIAFAALLCAVTVREITISHGRGPSSPAVTHFGTPLRQRGRVREQNP